MANWLFQANPKVFDVFAAHDSSGLTGFTVARHRDKVAPGDRAAVWVSGKQAGVYAVGRVTSCVREGTVDEQFVRDAHARRRLTHCCDLRIDVDLFERPISREVLRADTRFAGALILRAPLGGNPFPVTDEEWEAIVARIGLMQVAPNGRLTTLGGGAPSAPLPPAGRGTARRAPRTASRRR